MMSEEELRRPSDQTNFKMELNGQVQVQLLVNLHCIAQLKLCSVKYIVTVVYVRLHIFISSLPLFKHPKKHRFYKSFLISRAII